MKNSIKNIWLIMSWVLIWWLAYGLTINTNLDNAVLYLKSLIITSDGTPSGNQKVKIDGGNGDIVTAWSIAASQNIVTQASITANQNMTVNGNLNIRRWALTDGSIETNDIADNAVTNIKIATNAVNGRNIADGSVTTADIKDGTIEWIDFSSTLKNKIKSLFKLDWSCGYGIYSCTQGVVMDKRNDPDAYRWKCLGINGGRDKACEIKKTINIWIFRNLTPLDRHIWKTSDGRYIVDGNYVSNGCNNSKVPDSTHCIVKVSNNYILSVNILKNYRGAVDYCKNFSVSWIDGWKLPHGDDWLTWLHNHRKYIRWYGDEPYWSDTKLNHWLVWRLESDHHKRWSANESRRIACIR